MIALGQALPPNPRAIRVPASRALLKAGSRIPTEASVSCSATTTATANRKWTFRSGQTTRWSRADRTAASPPTSCPGRGWGLFTVKVPADFGDNKITWTIVANGKSTVIPASLKPDWEISPFLEAAVGNTPPVLSFDEHGPSVQGPQGLMVERTAKVGEPLSLTVWVSDDAKFTSSSGAKPKSLGAPVTLRWIPYRAPGPVVFSTERPEVKKITRPGDGAPFSGTATTTATFSEPGEYVVLVTANDYSGEGGAGFQCCWTTGQVRILVQR